MRNRDCSEDLELPPLNDEFSCEELSCISCDTSGSLSLSGFKMVNHDANVLSDGFREEFTGT